MTRKHLAILLGIAVYLGLVSWFSAALFELIIGVFLFQGLHLNLHHIKNLLYLVLIGIVAFAATRLFFWGGAAVYLLSGFRNLFLANRKNFLV